MAEQAQAQNQHIAEEVLRDFKSLMKEIIHLIRNASGASTATLHWINHSRQQFVLEATSTHFANTLFQDRQSFDQHYLNAFKEIKDNVFLEVDKDVFAHDLEHYFNGIPIESILLVPLISFDETVGIISLEFERGANIAQQEQLDRYQTTFSKILNAYLKLTDLQQDTIDWESYDYITDQISVMNNETDIIAHLTNQLIKISKATTVSFVCQHNEDWQCIYHYSDDDNISLATGLKVENGTLAYATLESGKTDFKIQVNNAPKILNRREALSEHGVLLLPLSFKSRRQGLFIITHSNALNFTEAIRHQCNNLVKIASLRLQALISNPMEPFLCNNHGVLTDKIFEWMCTQMAPTADAIGQQNYLALANITQISKIRVSHTAAKLQQLRKEIVNGLSPANLNIPGIVTEHSDFMYQVILFTDNANEQNRWQQTVTQKLTSLFETFFPEGTDKPGIRVEGRCISTTEDLYDAKKALIPKFR